MYVNNNQQNQNQFQNQAQAPITSNSSNSGNQKGGMVPEARGALNNMKYEIAGELGINLNKGYNGDLPSRQAGYIGGYMVNLMQPAEQFIPYWETPILQFTRLSLRHHGRNEAIYQAKVGVAADAI